MRQIARALPIVALAVLTACGGSSGGTTAAAGSPKGSHEPAAATQTITGTLTNIGGPCEIAGPYGWKVGDPVVILDGTGKLLAEGTLTERTSEMGAMRCDMNWTVADVPEGASGYHVRAVDENPVAYDWAQLIDHPALTK